MNNKKRAESIRAILTDFKQAAGLSGEMNADVIGDLVCNLAHYCDAEDIDFGAAVARAERDYEEESPAGAAFEQVTSYARPE